MAISKLITNLENIDRRWIYLFVLIALSIPLITGQALQPASMKTSQMFYDVLEQLPESKHQLVLIAMDWGPSTQAENGAQTAVTIEHLMRRRIPFAVITMTPYAAPFMEQLPLEIAKRLHDEDPSYDAKYGTDWVNLGYQPNPSISLQGIVKSDDLATTLGTDAFGTPIAEIPVMQGIKTAVQIPLLIEFTGLVGALNTWLQFFQSDTYKPKFLHGCTSITIPEAHIYLASKQLLGLHEGLAGAAAYEWSLSQHFPKRKTGAALKQNTSLAIAQLLIIALVLFGNSGRLLRIIRQRGDTDG